MFFLTLGSEHIAILVVVYDNIVLLKHI